MFNRQTPSNQLGLEKVIDLFQTELLDISPDTEDFTDAVANLTKLYALKEDKTPKRVSPDTLAIVVGNLVGIAIIVGYEQKHVVTSKALNFILKLR